MPASAGQAGRAVLAGTFLGGAIAPGPRALAAGLSALAARLPRLALESEAGPPPALGRTTVEAMRSGVLVGFRGAARELVRSIAREAQLERAPLLVTGGAAGLLVADGGLAAQRVDDLVHRGLLSAWEAGRRGQRA